MDKIWTCSLIRGHNLNVGKGYLAVMLYLNFWKVSNIYDIKLGLPFFPLMGASSFSRQLSHVGNWALQKGNNFVQLWFLRQNPPSTHSFINKIVLCCFANRTIIKLRGWSIPQFNFADTTAYLSLMTELDIGLIQLEQMGEIFPPLVYTSLTKNGQGWRSEELMPD